MTINTTCLGECPPQYLYTAIIFFTVIWPFIFAVIMLVWAIMQERKEERTLSKLAMRLALVGMPIIAITSLVLSIIVQLDEPTSVDPINSLMIISMSIGATITTWFVGAFIFVMYRRFFNNKESTP